MKGHLEGWPFPRVVCGSELRSLVQSLELESVVVANFPRIGVLVSGQSRGTNFQAILDAIARDELHARVALLIATSETHGAIARARDANIQTLILPPGELSREEWDEKATSALYQQGVSVVALAGYLRYVTHVLLEAFPGRILNVHPSLLPAFGGQGMWGNRVHRAVLEHGCKVSGCTVHIVDERYDTGSILAQSAVPVLDDDTPDSLSMRVQKEEHRLYPQCLELICHDKYLIEGRRVRRIGQTEAQS